MTKKFEKEIRGKIREIPYFRNDDKKSLEFFDEIEKHYAETLPIILATGWLNLWYRNKNSTGIGENEEETKELLKLCETYLEICKKGWEEQYKKAFVEEKTHHALSFGRSLIIMALYLKGEITTDQINENIKTKLGPARILSMCSEGATLMRRLLIEIEEWK